jgi:hypothetical protein
MFRAQAQDLKLGKSAVAMLFPLPDCRLLVEFKNLNSILHIEEF